MFIIDKDSLGRICNGVLLSEIREVKPHYEKGVRQTIYPELLREMYSRGCEDEQALESLYYHGFGHFSTPYQLSLFKKGQL